MITVYRLGAGSVVIIRIPREVAPDDPMVTTALHAFGTLGVPCVALHHSITVEVLTGPSRPVEISPAGMQS